MYSDADYQNAQTHVKRGLLIAAIIACVFITLMIAALVVRIRWLAALALVVGSWLTYGFYSFKASPWVKYQKFLKDMREGLSRETEGLFESVSEGARMSDGVAVHDLILRVDDADEDERLFYWDDDKPLPALKPGALVRVTSFGNYITKLTQL